MNYLATVLGLLAVSLFVLSYQIKDRKRLIAVNAASRVLYVAQYILLGAFEGALLDVVAFFMSVLCHNRDKAFIKQHTGLTIVVSYAIMIGVGLITYQNVFSLVPIFGVVFETLALWLRRERSIRIVSLAGAPFWLAYNLYSAAYGSAIGNVITLCSIAVAIYRYDIRKNKDPQKEEKKPIN